MYMCVYVFVRRHENREEFLNLLNYHSFFCNYLTESKKRYTLEKLYMYFSM